VDEQPIKRGRGRPRGSRNKPKTLTRGNGGGAPVLPVADLRPVARAAAAPVARPGNADTIGALEAQLDAMQRRFDALEANAHPRDVAALDAAIRAHTKQIAEMRGELKLTEAKIVRSEAWRDMVAKFGRVLAPFPEAMAAIVEAFEPEQ